MILHHKFIAFVLSMNQTFSDLRLLKAVGVSDADKLFIQLSAISLMNNGKCHSRYLLQPQRKIDRGLLLL